MSLRFYFLFVIIFSITHVKAEISITECGVYEMLGKVEKHKSGRGYEFIINEGSKSQYSIAIPPSLEFNISPYINRYAKFIVNFSKKIEGYQGEFSSIKSMSLAVPDPLGTSKEKTLKLLSKAECEK